MTTDGGTSSVTRRCPNCDYVLPPGRQTVCPNCHHSLILDEEDDQPEPTASRDLLQKPTQTSDNTETPIPPAVPPTSQPEAVPGVVCKACGHVNPPTQIRCERCATLLVEEPGPTPPLPPPEPAPRRTGRLVFLVVGALVLALILGSAAYLVMRRPWTSGGSEPSPSASTSTTAPAKLKPVAKKTIHAKASSTLPPDVFSYNVTNTFDGDPTTAWHSNGNAVGAFAKVTLTYTFSSPIRLRAIDVYNGYQRSTASFYRNSRVRRLLIATDTTKHRFELRDRRGKQRISFDFGPTKRAVLTVDAVYRDSKTKYKDCAISEVTFFRV
jgi:hypothetical protein